MKNKLFLTLTFFTILTLLLALPLAHAESYTLSVENVKNSITQGGGASYKLSFEAQESTTLKLEIDSDEWTSSISDEEISLNKGDKKTVEITLTPKENTPFGTYNIGLTVAEGEDAKTEVLELTYLESSPESVVTISQESNLPNKVKPGENLVMSIVLVNEKNAEIKNINLKIFIKNVLEYNKEVSLTNYEKKVLNLEIPVPLTAEPQDSAKVEISVSKGNKILSEKSYDLQILTVNPNLKSEQDTEGGLLKRTTTHKVSNTGNLPLNTKYSVDVSPLLKMFTSSEGKYNNGAYEWDLSLGAGETKELSVTYNYRWLAFIIVLVVLLIMGYQYIKPEIFLNKKLTNVVFDENGNFSEGRVTVTLKNKTGSPITGVVITEELPGFVEYSGKEIYGSMKPSSVKNLSKGSVLTWHLSEMSAGEERIVIYNIKSNYSVLRNVSLPPTVVSMQKGDVVKKLYSNNVETESHIQKVDEEIMSEEPLSEGMDEVKKEIPKTENKVNTNNVGNTNKINPSSNPNTNKQYSSYRQYRQVLREKESTNEKEGEYGKRR